MGEFCARKNGVFSKSNRATRRNHSVSENQMTLFKSDEQAEHNEKARPLGVVIHVEQDKALKAIAKAFQKLWGDGDVGPWIPESHETHTVFDELKKVALVVDRGGTNGRTS